MRLLFWRLAMSAGLVGLLLAVCLRLRHADRTTIALLTILAIVGLAKMWGSAEALTGAIIGAAGFDYYFLPPRGFGIANPEHWVALAAFLITAIATGQLAARLKKRQIRAEQRQLETEKLYQLTNAMLECGNAESTAARLADKLVEIFKADGAAIFDQAYVADRALRPRRPCYLQPSLHETAAFGPEVEDVRARLYLAPIRHGGELVGSIGMSRRKLSQSLLRDVAGRIGLGLARLYCDRKNHRGRSRPAVRGAEIGGFGRHGARDQESSQFHQTRRDDFAFGACGQ